MLRTKLFIIVFLSLESNLLRAQNVDLVDTAKNKSYTNLVDAINAANLTHTLKTTGPLTIFAPTNEKLIRLVTADLLKPENKKLLEKILLHHVVNGNLTATSITSSSLTTLQKTTLLVNKTGSTIRIDDKATVSIPDIVATNGILHIIDEILWPRLDIFETAVTTDTLKTLVKALRHADLVGKLQETGPWTVFAPNNAAFGKIDNKTLEDLLNSTNKDKLMNILKYHVVQQQLSSTSLTGTLKTLSGDSVTISKTGSTIKVNNATITSSEISTSNGFVYIIDTVLIPPTKSGVATLFNCSAFLFLVSSIFLRFF